MSMKVGELIALLQDFDPEADVLVENRDRDYGDTPEDVASVTYVFEGEHFGSGIYGMTTTEPFVYIKQRQS